LIYYLHYCSYRCVCHVVGTIITTQCGDSWPQYTMNQSRDRMLGHRQCIGKWVCHSHPWMMLFGPLLTNAFRSHRPPRRCMMVQIGASWPQFTMNWSRDHMVGYWECIGECVECDCVYNGVTWVVTDQLVARVRQAGAWRRLCGSPLAPIRHEPVRRPLG